jgi:peptidyl-prolyl cis-trans isomerase B (cyclophilin B)
MKINPNLSLKHQVLLILSLLTYALVNGQSEVRLKKRDLKRDLELWTSEGIIRLRLSNETPLHRDNFIKLAKTGYYNDILFHRVIRQFMIQAGDSRTKSDSILARDTLRFKNYTIPAEFRPELFHRRGALAAARMGDDVNPKKASSGYQFYIVQGRVFTETSLDSVEAYRLNGRKLPPSHREIYKTIGGAPHLDQNYTVFGEVIEGMEVVDRIAAVQTTGRAGGDKPLQQIRIRQVKLVKRKKTDRAD